MAAGFLILAGLALQAGPGSVPGTVTGVVRDATDGRPLPNALVTLIRDDRSTITNRDGVYLFRDVAPGERRVRATRIDFHPLEVSVDLPDGSTLEVDFLLTLRPVEMPAVEARASPFHHSDTLVSEPEPVTVGTAEVRVLDATPGVAEAGLAAAANVMLGPDPPAPDNVLFVRGAGAALDLVLLDGAPVQAPFHLGGLIQPSVAPSVTHAARLQGGVSPRWDGGLSDVLLLESRPGFGSPAHATLYVDMLSAGGIAEGGSPGRASWLVSARTLHGAGAEPFIEGGFPQEYSDGLVRLDVKVAEGDTVLVSGYWNRETVFIDPDDPEIVSPSWGNRAAALRFKGDLSIGRAELGGAFGEFETRLPIGGEIPLTADGVTRRSLLTADLSEGWGRGSVGYGIHLDRLEQRTLFTGTVDVADDSFQLRQRADANALSAYLEGGWPVTKFVHLSAGLRATTFSDDLGQGLSPRIRVDVFAMPELLVSLSAGRYRQLMVTSGGRRLAVSDAPADESELEPNVPSFTNIAAASSDHFLLAVTHSPHPGSELRVEGYWKNMGGIPDLLGGSLRYAGVDVWLRQTLGAFQFWGSYSLGWGWTVNDAAPDTDLYSGRHLLRGGFTKGFNGGVQLDAELSYGQGLEFGSIPRVDRPGSFAPQSGDGDASAAARASSASGSAAPVFSVPVPVPTPVVIRSPQGSYLRLNIQATGRIRARFLGREQTLFPYFRIINALDRNDALFYQSDGDPGLEPRAVGSIPILPVLGIEWRI
jgi:hypothetical protein